MIRQAVLLLISGLATLTACANDTPAPTTASGTTTWDTRLDQEAKGLRSHCSSPVTQPCADTVLELRTLAADLLRRLPPDHHRTRRALDTTTNLVRRYTDHGCHEPVTIDRAPCLEAVTYLAAAVDELHTAIEQENPTSTA